MHVRSSGFTLIELMIVIAIVALLATLAYPGYQEQVAKGRRVAAKNLLMTVASAQERFYSSNFRYTADMLELGFASASPTDEEGYYSVGSAVSADAQTFTLTATAAVADSNCGNFGLTSGGARTVTGSKGADYCW